MRITVSAPSLAALGSPLDTQPMKTPCLAAAALTLATLTPISSAAQGPTESAGSRVADAGVTIEYIAHASFIVESPSGTRVLIDPYADRVWLGYDFPRDLEYDAVVITHPHYDHDGGEYRELEVPWPEGTPVYRDAGAFAVSDVRLLGFPAKHADPYGKEFGQKNVVWILETGGLLRIAHIGDNGPLTDEVVRWMGSVDILMIPVDGEEHILTYEAVDRIVAQLRPRVVVPMHYRIPELEPGDGPSDLGPVDPWLAGRSDVRRLGSNVWRVPLLADVGDGVVVFEPSPSVPRPTGAEAEEPVSVMPRITVAWTEAPLRDVLRAFAFYSGRSIVAGSGVDGVFVTADIKDQPWDLALQAILESRGLTATENEQGIIRVVSYVELSSSELVQPIITRSYRISYSRAAELQATIASLLTERGSVSVLESSNTLVVSDVERVHRVVKVLLGR